MNAQTTMEAVNRYARIWPAHIDVNAKMLICARKDTCMRSPQTNVMVCMIWAAVPPLIHTYIEITLLRCVSLIVGANLVYVPLVWPTLVLKKALSPHTKFPQMVLKLCEYHFMLFRSEIKTQQYITWYVCQWYPIFIVIVELLYVWNIKKLICIG